MCSAELHTDVSGVLPGADFDLPVACALTGTEPERAMAMLEELVDAHLVQEPLPGRFRLHDLTRRYAADLAAEEEPQSEAALHHVLNHYLAQAIAHDRMLPYLRRDEIPPDDSAEGMAWFDIEHANLSACFDTAVRRRLDEFVVQLPQAMQAWFLRRNGSDNQVRQLEAAVVAAERLGRSQLRVWLLLELGYARVRSGRLTEALADYELAQQSDVDDDDVAGILAGRIAGVRQRLGDFEAAHAQFRLAQHLLEKTGNHVWLAQAYAFEAWMHMQLGRHDQAVELARLAIARTSAPYQITALIPLGAALASSDPEESLKTLNDALQSAVQDDNPHNQARCYNYLGVALRIMGSLDEALVHHRRAFELLEMLAEPQWELELLLTYAETCRVAGRFGDALRLLDRTIELARKLGRPYDEKVAREAAQAIELALNLDEKHLPAAR